MSLCQFCNRPIATESMITAWRRYSLTTDGDHCWSHVAGIERACELACERLARSIAAARGEASERVCLALSRLRTPQALTAALGTDQPEGVADVLLALTAWMDATGQVDMTKRTITFEARGEKYSLLTEGQLEQMRGETFSIVVDNLRVPTVGALYRQTEEFKAGIAYAAELVETVGSYYIAKYREALAKQPTDPSPSMG